MRRGWHSSVRSCVCRGRWAVAESVIDRLAASMARGEPVDWDAAVRFATTDEERMRIDALRAVERVAVFTHARWEALAPLVEGALATSPLHGERVVPEPAPALAGERIGAYTLESELGAGGMGSVWLARRSDGRFEGHVAVKLLHLPRMDRAGVARFEREGQILARLRHPHIAALLDAGVMSSGQPYLVLEYVDGVAIDRYCTTHVLGVRERVALFLDVLEAVAFAQANLVLHRDLKPNNILVDTAGRVKLLDFGVAKLLVDETSPAPETELTQRGGHAFTPEFAAP